jgi:DNA-binding CsgD family transcriptional regulator
MGKLNEFIAWLSFKPTFGELAQAMVEDYLQDLNLTRIRFGKLNSDDSAIVLGQFGYSGETVPTDVAIPGQVWRSLDSPEIHLISGVNQLPWSPDGQVCVVQLLDKGILQGHAVFEFGGSVRPEDRDCVLDRVRDYCGLLALFISFQSIEFTQGNPSEIGHSSSIAAIPLTPRQVDVLRCLVAGMTNLQIARQLGYSLSTIKQETMKVFHILAVRDRHEAAKRALTLNLG